MKNIVLVHGGFVDGSGWEGVYRTFKKMATTSASSRIPFWRVIMGSDRKCTP